MSSTENLRLLQEFDRHVEEVIFTADCIAWNEKRSSQILNVLLFIVKRTIEPRFQIILQPAWPVSTTEPDLCRFRLEESSDQIGRFKEVVETRFLLPSQQGGFVVFFNNQEDSTRAAECIKRLVDTTVPTRGTTEITEEQRDSGIDPRFNVGIRTNVVASGTPENNPQVWDETVYLQNTRVIMAMIAVLLATIVLSIGLNPPSSIDTLGVKIIFQITFWIAAVFSLAALLVLGVVTPTSFEMQVRIFRCGFFAISVAMVCVLVAFGATTISIATNLFTGIVGGVIGVIGLIMFSYFTSKTVRDFIFTISEFRLTQHANNIPYGLTRL